jgi:hypothetical protein
VFLIEWLRPATARSSAPTATETQSDEWHKQRCYDGHHGDDDDQPILLQQVVILMLLHVRSPVDFHVANDKVAWAWARKIEMLLMGIKVDGDGN